MDERENNIHVGMGATRESLLKLRTERDATLAMPKLIIPALQINMRAGEVAYGPPKATLALKIPINAL